MKFTVHLVLICLLGGSWPSFGQSPAPARSRIQSALQALSSPYAGERDAAVKFLRSELTDPAPILSKLLSETAIERLGAARVLGSKLNGPLIDDALTSAWADEKDRLVKEGMADALMRSAYSNDEGPRRLEAQPYRAALQPAAQRLVERELTALALKATRWTKFRKLGRFARLGPYAVPALERVVVEEAGLPVNPRCLAAMSLGRLDAPKFWGRGMKDPTRAAGWRVLDGNNDKYPADLKMAVLYAARLFAPDEPRLVKRVAKFIREDAFGGHLIEAGLYFLYTLPPTREKGNVKVLQALVTEYAGFGYTDRELFNSAQLLRRVPDADLVRQVLPQLKELGESFASYFSFCAALDNLALLPEEERASVRRDLLAWGSAPVRPPQVRLAAYWYERDATQRPPQGVDLEALKEEVRESVRAVHGQEEDSDFYAQRSGILILALFPDDQTDKVIKRTLNHSSEAVRMLGGLAAGDLMLESLSAKLVDIATTDGEYAAYAAARSLALLGRRTEAEPALRAIMAGGNYNLAVSALADLATLLKLEAPATPLEKQGWRELARTWGRP